MDFENIDIDQYFMGLAIEEAKIAFEKGEIPVGAVIVSQGRIIAKGHNLTEQLVDPTAHAEMLAVTAATHFLGAKYLTDCTLYVTLEPCPMCAGAMFWGQIRRIVIGASDPKRGYRHHSPSLLRKKTEVKVGVLADECKALLDTFFWKLRNQ